MATEEVSVKQTAICKNETCRYVIFNFYTSDDKDAWFHLHNGVYQEHCLGSPVAKPDPDTIREYERGQTRIRRTVKEVEGGAAEDGK